MLISFTKMIASGNDFIVLDSFYDRSLPADLSHLAKSICDRRYGVGADFLMLIQPSAEYHLSLRFFNADGTETGSCGNGMRCAIQYGIRTGLIRSDCDLLIHTPDRAVFARYDALQSEIRIDMGIPEYCEASGSIRCESINVNGREFSYYALHTGHPHCVIFLDESLAALDIGAYGPLIERDPRFPNGTNVEFCRVTSTDHVYCRVWSRNEGETGSCGTGSAAICAAGFLSGRTGRICTVQFSGGSLQNSIQDDLHIQMISAPGDHLFSGIYRYAHRSDASQ